MLTASDSQRQRGRWSKCAERSRACTFPLILWSVGTKCMLAVPIAYALSGAAQGGLIAWLNNKWRVQPDGRPSTV
jgi:hypothetical protein